MICNQKYMKVFIFLTLILLQEVKAEELHSYFLSCKGSLYLAEKGNEINLIHIEKRTNTYEIRNKNLYILNSKNKGILISPSLFTEHTIAYAIEEHPNLINKNYKISFDRINGDVAESYSQLGLNNKFVFRGECNVSNKKLF